MSTFTVRYDGRDGEQPFSNYLYAVFKSGAGVAYRSWDTLWQVSGVSPQSDSDADLYAYLTIFPRQHDEMIELVGTTLRRYFSADE